RSIAGLVTIDDRAVCRVEHELAAVTDVDVAAFLGQHRPEAVLVLDDALFLGLVSRLLDDEARRSTDVEGAERQLRARLSDGLSGDDAHGLADLDVLPGREVASVALRADAALRFAR